MTRRDKNLNYVILRKIYTTRPKQIILYSFKSQKNLVFFKRQISFAFYYAIFLLGAFKLPCVWTVFKYIPKL